MDSSKPPVCESCKPGEATEERREALTQLDCQATYDVVAACMEAHQGNVADCRSEWNEFRSCHEQRRSEAKKSHS